jgi:hypothetical protein
MSGMSNAASPAREKLKKDCFVSAMRGSAESRGGVRPRHDPMAPQHMQMHMSTAIFAHYDSDP